MKTTDCNRDAMAGFAPVSVFGDIPPRIVNADGSIRHINKDGARYHVVWWDSEGSHCSEPDCEINRRRVSPNNKLTRAASGATTKD